MQLKFEVSGDRLQENDPEEAKEAKVSMMPLFSRNDAHLF